MAAYHQVVCGDDVLARLQRRLNQFLRRRQTANQLDDHVAVRTDDLPRVVSEQLGRNLILALHAANCDPPDVERLRMSGQGAIYAQSDSTGPKQSDAQRRRRGELVGKRYG